MNCLAALLRGSIHHRLLLHLSDQMHDFGSSDDELIGQCQLFYDENVDVRETVATAPCPSDNTSLTIAVTAMAKPPREKPLWTHLV